MQILLTHPLIFLIIAPFTIFLIVFITVKNIPEESLWDGGHGGKRTLSRIVAVRSLPTPSWREGEGAGGRGEREREREGERERKRERKREKERVTHITCYVYATAIHVPASDELTRLECSSSIWSSNKLWSGGSCSL